MKTKEEVESSPIFKIVKKATMMKYPWIKDMYMGDEETLTKYTSMLFVDVDIDAQQMADQYGWDLEPWVRTGYTWDNLPYFETVYLATMVKKGDDQLARALQNDIEDQMKRIQKSNAIPSEYKIDKTIGINAIRYHFPPPPDNTTITN